MFLVLQAVAAVAMIALILLQTTKSEHGGTSSAGWGVIGGKSTSSIRTRWGVEEHLGRITTWVAVSFLGVSILAAVWRMHGW